MYELSVALKYLIPRWRQLSVSIISLVSMLVIALVVWLIVVFFSVKEGLENSWVEKIVALTAPIRITPTDKYYSSHYYLIDAISANSDYTLKSIGEKLNTDLTDPYNPNIDEEIPFQWTEADVNSQGQLKDLVKEAFNSSSQLGIKNLKVSDYETTFANIRLRILRSALNQSQQSQQFIENTTYVGSFDGDTPSLAKAIIPPSSKDFHNLLQMQAISPDNIKEESPDSIHSLETTAMQNRLQTFFNAIEVSALKTPSAGWRIPLSLLPKKASLKVSAVFKADDLVRIIIPANANSLQSLLQHQQTEGLIVSAAELALENGIMTVKVGDKDPQPLSSWVPLILQDSIIFPSHLVESSLKTALKPTDIRFTISGKIQKHLIQGDIALGRLEIAEAKSRGGNEANLFVKILDKQSGISMPKDPLGIEPILLPKNFKDSGALIGDQGYFSYYSPTVTTIQEQRIPIFVAGFYDPGIMPIGGKYILASKELTALIRASYNQDENLSSNGINVRFPNLGDAQKIKTALLQSFQEKGIAPYWNIATYQEFEFTKDLIQQLKSEKNLFSLISLIIIVVACSNIISMLIILVNDKKLEIGILRSMGATSGSIATIFGICGMVMGALGSLLGIFTAIVTLKYINELVNIISRFQGYDLFNPVFYGNILPSEMSIEVLTYVMLSTALISLLAGIVPAFKASMLRPAAALRAE